MADYSHFMFSSNFNSLRMPLEEYVTGLNVPRRVEQPEVDAENPYAPLHTGMFSGMAERAGKKKEYIFYVPQTMKFVGNLVFIFADDGQTARELYEAFDWAAALEKHEATGVFVAPEGDWDRDNPGEDLDYFLRIYTESMDNRYFVPTVCACYVLGFGTGAYMAALFSILFGSTVAAFAIDGTCNFSDELFDILGNLPSDGNPAITKKEASLPAWIIDGSAEGKKLLEFMKKANYSSEEYFCNDVAKVWLPGMERRERPLRGMNANQVWYSEKEPCLKKELPDRMLDFVVKFRRWRDLENGDIRYARTEKEMRLQRKDIEAGGLKRHFHVYLPSCYKNDTEKKLPMVLVFHGATCTGPFFADNTSWQDIAEERGFIAVFPTAYPNDGLRKLNGGGDTCPAPIWNSFIDGPDGSSPDELEYVRKILQVMKDEYAVDCSRIYVTGHSNGSGMTQYLMRRMPEVFAAFAPVGFMERYEGENTVTMPEDGIIRPVWYMMGEYDIGEGCRLVPGGQNWTALQKLCKCNRADYDDSKKYVNGVYHHMIAYNSNRVPLVRFTGVMGWPHTYTPEAALMIWDEFFCKYSRDEDGTIRYMGEAVGG